MTIFKRVLAYELVEVPKVGYFLTFVPTPTFICREVDMVELDILNETHIS